MNKNDSLADRYVHGFCTGGIATSEYAGAHLIAFNKANLINGVGVTLLWEKLIPDQIFLMPSELRMPLTNPQQPTYFVGQGGSHDGGDYLDTFAVYWGTAAGINSMTPALVPVNPMRWPAANETFPYSRQPAPAAHIGMRSAGFVATAVFYKGSLWTALSYSVSESHLILRWAELDVSTVWSNRAVSLVQEGDVNQGMDLDLSYAKLDVDRDGNMMITFVMSGPEQYVSLGYTGRLSTDPKGTLRYPLHIWAPGNSTYAAPGSVSFTRWADYIGGVFDPVDRKTFWMYGPIPNPSGAFNANGTATDWTSVIGTAHLDRNGECPPQFKTHTEHRYVNQKAENSYAASHPTPFEPEDGEVEGPEEIEYDE